MRYSASKENHLKAIFHLQHEQGIVTTNALAAALQTRAASVTDMLKKLKEQKLLIYERYKGFKLNNEGKKAAIQVIRKHRLWEYFLVEKLQFGWDEVHEIAEELEHISSKKLVDRLFGQIVRESVTQLAEYLPLKQEVVGSLPTGLTKLFRDSQVGKAPDCYSGHRRFESCSRSHFPAGRPAPQAAL